jgi:predicted TIM-barrel fold metal-dependent hydrolase
MRSPQAAAEELERAVKELGIIGFEILPPGLPVALGDSFYDPVYAAAEKCSAVLGIHGARNWSREFGAEGLNTFAEVHAYAFTAGILLQFTSMICQGVPVRFPELRLVFLEIGAAWMPYYLDRLDEHWEKRAQYEMPLLKERPSELVRKSEVYFSIESGESWRIRSNTSGPSILSTLLIFRTGIVSSRKTWSTSVTIRHCQCRSKNRSYSRMPSGFSSCDA